VSTSEHASSGRGLEAQRALERGEASALVVAKLDRLSRSMLDVSKLMAKATQEHWALVALDVALDTSTPSGEAMANMLATFSQFERRLILSCGGLVSGLVLTPGQFVRLTWS